MEFLAYLIVYGVIGYLPWTIAAYRLMVLARYRRVWRAFVPIWNVFMVLDLADKSRLYMAGFFIPIVSVVLLCRVGGMLAENTNQPKWVGWLLTLPIVHILGLPALALTAPSNSTLPGEFVPGTPNEYRYRYKGSIPERSPLETRESVNTPEPPLGAPVAEQGGRQLTSEEVRALEQIGAYLSRGHTLSAIREAGWQAWIEHLEHLGYDLRTGRPRT